jgi:hypothetical protein
MIRRFSKTDVDFAKFVNFDVCSLKNFVINSFDIVINFLKVWDSLIVNFSIAYFSIVMIFFSSWKIFLRVWTRVFRDSMFDSSNTWNIISSSFSKNSSHLRRFDWVIISFLNWRRFSRLSFSTSVTKRRDCFVILTNLWLFVFLSILARGSSLDWITQMSSNDSLIFIVDTSEIIRRSSFLFFSSSWSWYIWQIII